MQKHRVVIVGGGFAGLGVAKSLRNSPVEITLVDRSNHHLFQPLLYQVAMGGLNPAEIASPIRVVLRKQKNATVWMGEVTAIDTINRTITLDDGAQTLSYDTLVLAAGGRTSYFGHEEWEKVAPGLKTLEDALKIRQRVLLALERAERCQDPKERERLSTMVVIGGGPTGVEMAGGLAELTHHVLRWDFRAVQPSQARIVLLEGGPALLAAMPPHLSEYTRRRLEKMGVEVRTSERVQTLERGRITTDKGEILAENIIWAAGVGGNPLGKLLGAEMDRGGRVVVEADLRVKGMDNVYVLGDMASYVHPHTYNGKPLPGVAPVAMQHGAHCARNIKAQLNRQPTTPFHYFDKGTMATIGRSSAVAVSGPLKLKSLPAWFAWLFIHVAYLVDLQNQVLVIMRWVWAYFTWKWNARLITNIPKLQPYQSADPKPVAPRPTEPENKPPSDPAQAESAPSTPGGS
ncbi:MAG: NAD(P)/FAD-dependent oxidoreductase [Vulcanimicrobiota bacterium]